MPATPATPATPAKPVTKGGKKHAKPVLTATHVLHIYSDGQPDPWKRVVAKFPEFAIKGRTGAQNSNTNFDAETVLAWAVGVVAGDSVKQAMAARVIQAIASIGFDATGKTTDRLSALKLLGQECGMFTNMVELDGKLAIEKIQREIVDPKNADPKSVDSQDSDC